MANKKKEEKSSVRNDWIPATWRYNGAGFSKDKKKESKRGYQKHKKKGLQRVILF